jgi:hypothetical protein
LGRYSWTAKVPFGTPYRDGTADSRIRASVLKNSCDAPLLSQIEHQNTDLGGFWPDLGSSIGAPATSSTAWSVFDTAYKTTFKSQTDHSLPFCVEGQKFQRKSMKVIGHRGAASLAPENTFAGFDLALEMGVDALETDVQRTKDGKLVLFHDARIERTTNGRGRLQYMAWEELRGLDAGSWFHRRYTGERIPLLTVFLQKHGRRIPIELEVK